MSSPRTWVTTLAVTALAASLATSAQAAPQQVPAAPAAAPQASTATISENAKLNKVRTPNLSWFSCYQKARCAKVRLPLDYDNPNGPKTNVAVLRIPATGKRIGTLFVNPGGPGGSATEMAYGADGWASPAIREKFDIVGVDPRGVGFSDVVKCLPVEEQEETYAPLRVGVPYGYTQEMRYLRSMKKIARACSTNTLARSMSTAEVARDMEMVRRAIGDGKLSYLGFSYGTHLGTTYANMFPGNFRSIAIDGTLNPRSWSGTSWNQHKPLDFRLGSGKGAWKAMRKVLAECDKAGAERCSFAAGGPARPRFDAMAERLKRKPLVVEDPMTGEPQEITYGAFVNLMLGSLYSPMAPQIVDAMLTELEIVMTEYGSYVPQDVPAPMAKRVRHILDGIKDSRGLPGREFLYDSSMDAFLSVTCTDSKETTKLADYRGYAKESDTTAPHFGRAWLFNSSGCAGDAFTGQDEDAYTGPYNRYTPKAVLVVGNYWDPATAYTGAVETRKHLSRARLVSSDSWGHTAYGTSQCVTRKVDRYLLSGTAPLSDSTCPAESEVFPAWEEPEMQSPVEVAAEVELPEMADTAKEFPQPAAVR